MIVDFGDASDYFAPASSKIITNPGLNTLKTFWQNATNAMKQSARGWISSQIGGDFTETDRVGMTYSAGELNFQNIICTVGG